MRLPIWLIAMTFATSANAMTGAEFLQFNPSFARGYVLGIFEARALVIDPDKPGTGRIRKCLMTSKITAGTMHEVARNYISGHPALLAQSAFFAVNLAIEDMCKDFE